MMKTIRPFGVDDWERLIRALRKIVVLGTVSCFAVIGSAMLLSQHSPGTQAMASPPPELLPDGSVKMPGPLSSVPVPKIERFDEFVEDRNAAILLGKALFWDIQVGGDGKTACATCHFAAGVDNRTVNTLAPQVPGVFRGSNYQLKADDFPFHKVQNPDAKREGNPVLFDTSEVVGSTGVVKRDFVSITAGNPVDNGVVVQDSTFHIGGANARQVTGRNAPSIIGAVFNDRNFWDGRANRFFNGVNPFGDMDPDARVWAWSKDTGLQPVRILLDNGSLASQAVGPCNNEVEMSWRNRTFPELARKMFSLRPLALQTVDPNDSVLGSSVNKGGLGLSPDLTYPKMIRAAFKKKWWGGTNPVITKWQNTKNPSRRPKITPDESFTQMEKNFSLFWGFAMREYMATLVADKTPFDKFAAGSADALTAQQKVGLDLFLNAGKCINCHAGPEFTGASISHLRGDSSSPHMIEFMKMAQGEAFYDAGFYNIGVSPTEIDLGVGGLSPFGGPLSLSRRVQNGEHPNLNGQDVHILPSDRVAVDGAFKTPTVRNVELTGPYFHNGGQRTLREVVQFYARGTDFENIKDRDPDVDGIPEVMGVDEKIDALVAFMKSLTDERVRYQRAPFDHPELPLPVGHEGAAGGVALDKIKLIPAVGAGGSSSPLKSFEELLPN